MQKLIMATMVLFFSMNSFAGTCKSFKTHDESIKLQEILTCADDPSISISTSQGSFATNLVKISSDASIQDLRNQEHHLLTNSLGKQVTLAGYNKTILEISEIQEQIKEERMFSDAIIKQIVKSIR